MPTKRSTSPTPSSSGSTPPIRRASKGVAFRLAELAELVGGRIEGDPDREVEAVRSLDAAGPRDLSFLTHPRYRAQALASAAGALLVGREVPPELLAAGSGADSHAPRRDLLVVDDPAFALARLLAVLSPAAAEEPGIHP